MLENLIDKDQQISLWMNSLNSPFFDGFMSIMSDKNVWIFFYLFLILFSIYVFRKQSYIIIIFAILAVALSDSSSVHLFKNIFERLRPCHDPTFMDLLNLPDGCGGKYGFVSSHAANHFSLTMFFVLVLNMLNKNTLYRHSLRKSKYGQYNWIRTKTKWINLLKYSMIVWATIISYSRIYLGAHYLGDILCGALLGVLTGSLSFLLMRLVLAKFYPSKG